MQPDTCDIPRHPGDILTIVVLLPAVAGAAGLIQAGMPFELFRVWLPAGFGGLFLGAIYWHSYRGTGFVPYLFAAIAAVGGVACAAGAWCGVTVGLACGLLGVAFARLLNFFGHVGRSGEIVAILLICVFVTGTVPLAGSGYTVMVSHTRFTAPEHFVGVMALLVFFALLRLFRPCFELTCEPVLWWMYKIRAAGPGVKQMAPVGSCIVVANHASWLDPLFLAKVLPRRTTPMMTSKFYDKPVIGWLVRRFGVIRVPDKHIKQETPELREAVAALDRGECVVIFPEGFLRRSDDKPLKRFGRGVWRILRERPNTPVYTCWIEGAWGSYCSYFNGKPTVNKKRDRRRPIGIGVSAAVTVPADVLANHLRARVHLMNLVLAARAHLGLEAIQAVELPTRKDE